jgi:hypothetical protein
MAEYPRTVHGDDVPAGLRSVIDSLTTRLLSGVDPVRSVLRDQYSRATIQNVELTGAGFFARFAVPRDTPIVKPARLIGGHVVMEVEGLPEGAGSLLCVSDGRLDFLEVFVYGDEPWTESTVVLTFGEVIPLPTNARAT